MSIDLGIIEKLRKLKAMYDGESPEAVKQIEEWEKRITELSQLDDFANLNTTKEIIEVLKGRLKAVLLKRIGKGLAEMDLRVLDAREEELRFVLERVFPSFSSELEQIESLIDSELNV